MDVTIWLLTSGRIITSGTSGEAHPHPDPLAYFGEKRRNDRKKESQHGK